MGRIGRIGRMGRMGGMGRSGRGGRGGGDGGIVLFQVGADDVGEGAGDVAEEAELEAADLGFPEGFGGEKRFAEASGKGAGGGESVE